MTQLSVFDVAGPVMVGPSSSHTAGACKIGQFARALFHGTPAKATFYLHGSFAEVYKGHATDKALLAGVMKLRTSDPRIKDALTMAKHKHLSYEFKKIDLKKEYNGKEYHPNSVKIVLENSNRKLSMIGSSVGGGVIEILRIDKFDIHLQGRVGKYLSIIVCHENHGKKVINEVLGKIKKLGIRIVDIQTTKYRDKNLTIIGTDGRDNKRITVKEVVEIEKTTKGVEFVRSLSKLEKQ